MHVLTFNFQFHNEPAFIQHQTESNVAIKMIIIKKSNFCLMEYIIVTKNKCTNFHIRDSLNTVVGKYLYISLSNEHENWWIDLFGKPFFKLIFLPIFIL